ncbi:MAG: PD-(D/E)XK nuclease family protein [Pseudomonadota bacterium]|nr:PD-(D/E)XK nuclease family protein [Pseudomonadota bacterium]
MEQIVGKLLNEVAFKIGALREARKRFSAQLAPEFRIFDYLRNDEMGLSRCISTLLNPNGLHGQGSVFLDAFLNQIGPTSAWAVNATQDCKVITEKQANGQRRIDICLDFGKVGIIAIENKPWAKDQKQQLSDYAKFIEKHTKRLLIYLSNSDPSEVSIKKDELKELEKSGHFFQLTYKNIIDWLEDCARKSKALVVRIFIEELAKYIRMDINGELDMSEQKELKDVILKSKEHLESAFHVVRAIDDVKKELLEKFRKDLEGSFNKQGMKLVWDLDNWKAYRGFIIQFGERLQSSNLRFEFNNKNLIDFFWGIAGTDDPYSDAHTWKKINELMITEFGREESESKWPWYSWAEQEFGEGMDDWQTSEKPWLLIHDGSLVKKITELAIRVKEVFSKANQFQLLLK